MKLEFVDFKTVKLNSMLDTGMSSELSLTQSGKVSAKLPDEWNGYAVLYLSIKISDPEEKACEAFGVMKLKNMYGKQVRGIERSTFLIDAEGNIAREWRGVKVAGHAAEVLAAARAL